MDKMYVNVKLTLTKKIWKRVEHGLNYDFLGIISRITSIIDARQHYRIE